MTSKATSVGEFWLIGPPSSPASTGSGEVIRAEFVAAKPLPLPQSVGLDALVARYEADPARSAALKAARVAIADEVYGHKPRGLGALRLRTGLSQTQLATLAGTSQAHIARIEAGKNDPGTSVVARIAAALGVSEADAFVAIRADQTWIGRTA